MNHLEQVYHLIGTKKDVTTSFPPYSNYDENIHSRNRIAHDLVSLGKSNPSLEEAIYDAIKLGDLDLLDYLHTSGVDLMKHGMEIIETLIIFNHTNMIYYLIDHGMDLQKCKVDEIALCYTIYQGYFTFVKELISHNPIYYHTSVYWASLRHPEMMQYLLETYHQWNPFWTMLFYFGVENSCPNLIRYILDQKVDVTILFNHIMHSVSDFDIFCLLLELDAPLDSLFDQDEISIDILIYLIENQFDLEKWKMIIFNRFIHHEDLFFWAFSHFQNVELDPLLKEAINEDRLNLIIFLSSKGAKFIEKSYHARNPDTYRLLIELFPEQISDIYCSAIGGKGMTESLFFHFVELGANVLDPNQIYFTYYKYYPRVVDYLLENGVDLNGDQLLSKAIRSKEVDNVLHCLDLAKVVITDDHMFSALHRNLEMIPILWERASIDYLNLDSIMYGAFQHKAEWLIREINYFETNLSREQLVKIVEQKEMIPLLKEVVDSQKLLEIGIICQNQELVDECLAEECVVSPEMIEMARIVGIRV